MTTRRLPRQTSHHSLLKYSIVRFLILAMDAGNNFTGSKDSRINGIRERKCKILVIDDDNDFRKSFCFKLKRIYKAQVEDVDSGKAGIKKLMDGNSYDFIFTDIMMPEMTGIETYHELRKLDGEIRIIIMSAYSNSEEWKKAQDLAVPLLHKPILDEDQLIDILGA